MGYLNFKDRIPVLPLRRHGDRALSRDSGELVRFEDIIRSPTTRTVPDRAPKTCLLGLVQSIIIVLQNAPNAKYSMLQIRPALAASPPPSPRTSSARAFPFP